MKKLLKNINFILIISLVVFASCKKEKPSASVATACVAGSRTQVPAQLIPFGTLSIPRINLTIAAAGNKILFAGGTDQDGEETSRVDIYDIVTQTWATAELSSTKNNVAAVTLGNKIYFAGGHTVSGNSYDLFATVDIYDASANSWSTAQLVKIVWILV